jgi:hypothetical protein
MARDDFKRLDDFTPGAGTLSDPPPIAAEMPPVALTAKMALAKVRPRTPDRGRVRTLWIFCRPTRRVCAFHAIYLLSCPTHYSAIALGIR